MLNTFFERVKEYYKEKSNCNIIVFIKDRTDKSKKLLHITRS